jgi:hypothetical protein
MSLLLFVGLLVGVTVVPVMVGARVVGARKTGFGSALFAVILLAVLSAFTQEFVPDEVLAFLVSAAGGAAIFAFTLGTTLLRGLAVSVVVVAVQVVVIVLFPGTLQ